MSLIWRSSETDYRTTIARVRSKGYDAIAAYLDPKQVPVFFRQAKEQSLTGPFLGTTTFQSRDSIKDAGGAMEGAVFAHNYVSEEFRRRFSHAYGTGHQIPWAANAYDFAILIGEEFGRAEVHPSAGDIMARMRNIGVRSGAGYRLIEE